MKFLSACFLALPLLFASCVAEENDDAPSRLNIQLTDAPGDYDSVLIDIQQIEITTNEGKRAYPVQNPGVYNLLDFTGGYDTLLISEELAADRVNQIRLILGDNNSVVVNGTAHPLATPSAQQSGLKLNVQATLTAGAEYSYLLDFDAARSIVQQGNGGYLLKPVIRVITIPISSAIEGHVNPPHAAYYAYVLSGTDTLGSGIDSAGYFKIVAVPSGMYTLNVLARPGYADQSLSNIAVGNGQVNDVDTLNF